MSQERRLNIRVNLDTGTLERDAAGATNTLKGIGNEAENQGKRMTEVFKNVGTGIAAMFAIERIKSFIGEIINVRSEIQSLSVSFETLLGSKEKADQLFGQIRKYAANTPMQLNDLAAGAQTMLGFNIEAKKVMPIMQAIGDISMGNRDKFNSLTLAFAQMSATGKLMGQDLLQMINAGFNPLTVISEQTGKAISTLKDEMSSGAISAKMVEDAFKAASAEGGKFHGMLDQQSKTLRGSISNLQGAFTDMLNDFGESSEGIITGGVNTAYEMVKNYKETAETLLVLIGIMGVYKAAFIAHEALEAAALDRAHAKVAAIGAVNAAQATGFELEVQQAVAKGALNKAEAEELLMQYELAKARVADLTSLKVQAQAEKESAIVAQAAAVAKVKAAEEQVIAANMKYAAALRSADGERIERAELALGTVQCELDAASKAHMAAMTNTAAASKKADAAATAADTAAQQLNTLSMNNGSRAAGFLTLAKTQLRNATTKLYATMMANPLGLILAAVVALGYGIYKLCTYETEAEKAQKRLNEAHAQAQGAVATEQAEIKKLFDALKKAKEGTEAYKKAKEDIWSRYGKYLKALGDENTALKDQAKAYALVARKAREAAMAKAREAFMDNEGKENAKKMGEIYLKAYNLVKKKYGKAFADANMNNIRRIVSGDANVNKGFLASFNTIETRTAGASVTGYTQTYQAEVNYLQQYINEGKKQMQQFNDLAHQAVVMFGSEEDPGDGAAEVTVNFSKELADAKKTRDTAKKNWQKLAKSTSSTKAQVEAAYKAYKTAQSTYDDLLEMGTGKKEKSGSGGGKTEAEKAADRVAAFQKETDLNIQQLRERRDAILKYETELEQARIDIIDDGIEKRRRQRELDMAKELADLQARMQQEIDAEVARQKAVFDAQEEANAAGKKNYAKRTFNPGQTLALQLLPGQTIGKDADTGNVKTAEINAIAARYGVLYHLLTAKHDKSIKDQQKADQLAMNEYLQQYGTYEEKKLAIAAIYAAKRATATTDAEQMQLAQEENKALNDVEFDDFMTNRAALAFGEIDNLSRSTIARLIVEMEKYRDKITQTFDPDKIEKFNRALSGLKRAQAMSKGGLFSQLFTPAFFKERKAAIAEINAAERTHNDLLTAKAQKEEEVKKKIEEIIAKVKELTGQDLTPDQVKDGSTVSNIIGQLGANGNQQGGADLSNLMSGLNGARAELGQVTTASNKAGASLGQLKEAFSAKFTGQGGELARVDAIVHGINDIVQGANETVKELAGTADALGADTSVGSGWDKAQTFMQGFADASAGATEAFESLKSGNIMGVVSGVTKSFTSWVKAFAAIHDASRERTIQRLQDEIDELERMNRRIEHNLEEQYSKQASQSYDEEIKNLEKQRRLIQQQIAAEEDKKNTDDDRIQEWENQLEELGWKIEEYKDKALDAILGEDISTSIDNFTDALAESWGRFGDRARAVKDYVKTILRQMVIEAMKTDLSEPIRTLREMMAKALDDDVITEQEQSELEAFAQQLAEETERKYKWADSIINDGTSDSGSGTTGTFATASQDSITELSGRAAAIHTSGEMRRELLLNISVDVAELKAQAAASAESTAEMRELQMIAVGHLETIARNTYELYEMNERLDKIERNTRGL